MMLKNTIKSIAGTVAQMLFPEGVTCLACGNELDGSASDGLCAGCRLEFHQTFCRVCGRKIDNLAELCDKCMEHGPFRFELARSSAVFDDAAKKLIYAFKYGGAKYLAKHLAAWMAETAECNGLLSADAITFVPLHKKRQRKRGYNQSELLAKSLAAQAGLPCEGLLVKSRHTQNLAKLSRAERGEIIRGTFELACAKESVKGKSILLVDDVLTTGATCDECARVLARAGAESVTVLTFASVQAHHIW